MKSKNASALSPIALASLAAAFSLAFAFGFEASAHADQSRSEILQTQAARLSQVEKLLVPQDQQAMDYYLTALSSLLDRYPVPQTPLYSCISNGESGSFEKFNLTNLATGQTLGGATQFDTCKELQLVQRNDLICLSNGQYGSFEKFVTHDLALKRDLGGYTDLKTCQTLVSRSQQILMCTSNGEYGSFEKFTLYNRTLKRMIGGGTHLESCLSTLGQ